MPNNCNGVVYIYSLEEKQKDRISRRAKNGTLCEQIIPYPKEVKEDLKMEREYNREMDKLRKRGRNKEESEELSKKYPYKQLWYDWEYQNRGAKRGLCDCSVNDTGPDSLELYFWTARGPVLPVFKRLSEKYHCIVEYDYDEPGAGFSGRVRRENGLLIYQDQYDGDPYYGEGVKCSKCGGIYDGSTEEDRSDCSNHICFNCGQ